MKMALRTQQIIAEETNVSSVVDPLGGSYFVESLTTSTRSASSRFSTMSSATAARSS